MTLTHLVRWTLLGILIPACTTVQAETSAEAAIQLHARYTHAAFAYADCLTSLGFPATPVLSENGVFYAISFENPPVASVDAWDEHDKAREKAQDTCYTTELDQSSRELESLVRPTDEALRTIAQQCATESGLDAGGDSDIEDLLATIASAEPNAARCIADTIAEVLRSTYGGLFQHEGAAP